MSTPKPTPTPESTLDLGIFSLSLAVKDLSASHEFYKKLGFSQLGCDTAHNYLILKNGDTVIGLFQGMFEGNMMTFNPGWDSSGENTESFTDIRALEQSLIAEGVALAMPIPAETAQASGPASLMLADPDGNMILIDQHR